MKSTVTLRRGRNFSSTTALTAPTKTQSGRAVACCPPKSNNGHFSVTHQTRSSLSVWLVVSISLKNMKVSWDDYSQYGQIKKCSKPPTSSSLSVRGFTVRGSTLRTAHGIKARQARIGTSQNTSVSCVRMAQKLPKTCNIGALCHVIP